MIPTIFFLCAVIIVIVMWTVLLNSYIYSPWCERAFRLYCNVFLTVKYCTTGATAAYGIGFSSADWSRWGEVALGALSALEGGALFAMVFSANIWVCYCSYIIFKSLYMLLITIAM